MPALLNRVAPVFYLLKDGVRVQQRNVEPRPGMGLPKDAARVPK